MPAFSDVALSDANNHTLCVIQHTFRCPIEIER
jgi:hypothetical protein